MARLLAKFDTATGRLNTIDTAEYVVRDGAGKELVRLLRTSNPSANFSDATINGSTMIGTMHAGPELADSIARRHVDSTRCREDALVAPIPAVALLHRRRGMSLLALHSRHKYSP